MSGSKALALRPARMPAPKGSAAAIEIPGGGVSVLFVLEGFDWRRGVATYSLRVVNNTRSGLVCRTWVISRKGAATLAYPILFEVQPCSTAATQIPVWPRDFHSFDRAIAEVAGEGVHCLVEAPAPRVKKRPRYALLSAASLLAGVLLLAGAAVVEAVPKIVAFAVPPEALAGTTVRAEYDVSGAGQLSYAVTAPDGRRLQGSVLNDRSGSIPIAIPNSSEPGAYTLQITIQGVLGTTSETRVLNAIEPRSREDAQIDDISVHPAVVRPGQTLDVAYSAAADTGYLRLLGSDGTIWAQKPFSSDGQSQFVVPAAAGLHEMRVLLHVTKGRSTAQSMAGIVVAAPAGASAADNPQIAADDDPNLPAATSDDANGTFEVLTKTVRSGGPIAVKIISPRNGMRVSLMDTQSHEISGLDAGADANVVTLRAPTVRVPTRYIVEVNFTDGFGQESIVQPVTVLP